MFRHQYQKYVRPIKSRNTSSVRRILLWTIQLGSVMTSWTFGAKLFEFACTHSVPWNWCRNVWNVAGLSTLPSWSHSPSWIKQLFRIRTLVGHSKQVFSHLLPPFPKETVLAAIHTKFWRPAPQAQRNHGSFLHYPYGSGFIRSRLLLKPFNGFDNSFRLYQPDTSVKRDSCNKIGRTKKDCVVSMMSWKKEYNPS